MRKVRAGRVILAAVFLIGAVAEADARSKRWKKVVPRAFVKPIERAAPIVPLLVPGVAGAIGGAVISGQKPAEALPGLVAPGAAGGAPSPGRIILDEGTRQAVDRLGPNAARVREVLEFPERYRGQLSIQGVRTLMSVLENGNLGLMLTAPLAAAIHDGIAHYQDRAQPIPEQVKEYLSFTFDRAIIDRARYVIDRNVGTLPGIINRMHHRRGVHGVVVGHIIVFSSDPGSDIEAAFFWGHELQHVAQYAHLGVERFADQYSRHWALMEAEADRMGRAVAMSVQ